MRYFYLVCLLFLLQTGHSQIVNSYRISFENAHHHEAYVEATFTNLQSGSITFRMSRTTPGKYGLHEFAKNIYNVKFTDSKDKEVNVIQPNLHQWNITGHDGTIKVSYYIFADQGDGTFSQINQNHAIINNPSTFMYIPNLSDRPIELTYMYPDEYNWKIATQLTPKDEKIFTAPDLYYFMDSPTLLSNFIKKSIRLDDGNYSYEIQLALNHKGSEEEATLLFENIKKIIEVEKEVFGDYPIFENKTYTFLASFLPQVSNEGIAHRNSSVISRPESLSNADSQTYLTTFAHTFFNAWNLKRIRPQSFEPYDFGKESISEELWFSEGFSSYYALLTLCRAGIINQEEYLNKLSEVYNEVWNSPALKYYTPRDMSKKAPFIDTSKDVASTSLGNSYISHASYGHMLGLALDLALRNEGDDLFLDDFMQLFWTKYGKTETPFTVDNLFITLREYASESFADDFFADYVNQSEIPDFKKLLNPMAIYLKSNESPYLGAKIDFTSNGFAEISEYSLQGTPAYEAGLEKGDNIIAINNKAFSDIEDYYEVVSKLKIGKKVAVQYKRNDEDKKIYLKVDKNPNLTITQYSKPSEKALARRKKWLKNEN